MMSIQIELEIALGVVAAILLALLPWMLELNRKLEVILYHTNRLNARVDRFYERSFLDAQHSSGRSDRD